MPDNRYAEPIFIYCYKVNTLLSEGSPYFTLVFPPFSHLMKKRYLFLKSFMLNLIFILNDKNILFIKSISSNTDINSKQNKCRMTNVFK